MARNNIHILVTSHGKVSKGLKQLRESTATEKAKARFLLATDGAVFPWYADNMFEGFVRCQILIDMCNLLGYNLLMIKTFAHKGLEKLFKTGSASGVQPAHARKLRLILALLDEAIVIKDMDAPALRLHQLKGNMKDIWAVTVQANWRVTFRFIDGDAHIVNYQDYH